MEKFTQIKKINEEQELDSKLYPSGWKDLDGIMFGMANKNKNLIEEPATQEKPEIVKFLSKIFETREVSHMYHLQVKGDQGSYAAHMALGSYYESIQDLIDSLVEVYQGQYSIVEGYDIIDTSITQTKEKIAYFQEAVAFVRENKGCIPQEDTHLHNIIDEIVALLYRTLYKLKYNR
jgi:DNA-binding ferritin-like protein